ncbi:hypothetical protein [Sphingomonas sp.]|uniref:hypothetical protein n=1 Tax=Sphingomonas sp. TaxID=28214 RepID=UPI002DD62A95|nr:hypothetical protein [Sphingomonas sp.]
MPAPAPLPPKRRPIGPGGPFVLALFAGVIIGLIYGQPTIGFLGGLATGIAVALLIWLRDRT